MSVTVDDVKFRKSAFVTDSSGNGGRKGLAEVVSGFRHNLFPRVTKAERDNGLTRFRKEFWCNEEPDDDVAYGALFYLEAPSNAGDRFYLGAGTQTNTQAALTSYAPCWMGTGKIASGVTAGNDTVDIEMESDDFQFPNGGLLHISDKFATSQTIGTGVKIGDSVEYNDGPGEWQGAAATTDITYPKGLYLGANTVMTIEPATKEEWLRLADFKSESEVIGTGDGTSTQPTLSDIEGLTPADDFRGLCRQPGKLPVIKATCGGVERSVYVAADGVCSGYCTAGELNMATGVWVTDIIWSTAPDAATDIEADYYENCFRYSGNTATVFLESGEQFANSYSASNSYAGGCIEAGDVAPSVSDWVENSSGGGTYDESGHPLIMFNEGTEEDTWTITFNGVGTFSCAGANAGSVGTGAVGSDFSPTNPNTGQPYFKLEAAGWAGSWDNTPSADTLSFKTHPATVPLWLKQVVPAGTSQEPQNLVVLGWYCE